LLKKLHEPSLHVVNLAGNQNQKMQVMSAEPITATQQPQTCQSRTQKKAQTQPQKSHSLL
jgi:hypothetical protein